MSKLPEECGQMANLERLDISHNTFISLPTCIFRMASLQQLKANDNHIVGKCNSIIDKFILIFR